MDLEANRRYWATIRRMWDYIYAQPRKMVEVRVLARRYRTSQQAILDMCEDDSSNFTVNVGIGTMGGCAEFELQGDYMVEALSHEYIEPF